ncbi:Molybdopterin synthase sulfur carrier subunit [compost metagenome]
MIRVQYFARYREQLGLEEEALPWTPSLSSLGDLHRLLLKRGQQWTATLGEANLMCARNQDLCSLEEPLQDGDEIAFFPTVTGG